MIIGALALLIACTPPQGDAPATQHLWTEQRLRGANRITYATPASANSGTWTVTAPAVFSARLTTRPGSRLNLRYSVLVDGQRLASGDKIRPGMAVRVPIPGQGPVQLTLEGAPDLIWAQPQVYIPKNKPKRVILVMIDTLQANHLGAWGYDRPTSPQLDKLASLGTRWAHTYAPAPWTLPSTRALLTGRLPSDFGQSPALAQRLHDAGWATGAITRNPWLAQANGISRGFGMHDQAGPVDAMAATERALSWLTEHADQDTFLFLHHMDPHSPYGDKGVTPPDLAAAPIDRPALTEGQRDSIAGYDADLRYVDDALGVLWAGTRDLPGHTLLVVTADHGEELWEHHNVEHGQSLYVELIHVPLLMVGPGVPAQVQTGASSLLDVAPTILSWAGLDTQDMAGRDLLAPTPPPMPPLLIGDTITQGEAVGLVTDDHRYWLRAGHEHLFATADTGDLHDLAATQSTEQWREKLEELYHFTVRTGGVLLLPRRLSHIQPPVTQVTVDWGVPVRQVRATGGTGHIIPPELGVEALGTTSTLRLQSATHGALTAELESLPTGPVMVTLNGDRQTRVNACAPKHRSPLIDGKAIPMEVRAGPIVWPLADAPRPAPMVIPNSSADALRALGYLDK